MSPSSRYVRARVVSSSEFRSAEFAGEAVAGAKRKLSAKERQIRKLLRRARKLKTRVRHLQIQHPLGWKRALSKAKVDLRLVLSDLKAAGWKPKKPTRARKPGEDETDAALDDIPEPEPGESDDGADEGDDPADAPEAEPAAEGNWLDGYVGAEPPKRPLRELLAKAGQLVTPRWSKPVALGTGAKIATRPGQRAMVATIQPGLFIVQLVSDQAAQRLAGDNVGILPLLLFPLVKKQVQKALAPQPAAPAPAQPAAAVPAQPAAPAPADVGCDCNDRRGR